MRIENLAAGREQPAERVGQRERHTLARALVQTAAVGIGAVLQTFQRPQPHSHGGCQRARAGAGTLGGDPAHLLDPRLELRQEERVGHGDGELAPLHRFRSLVGRFQLRIHPLVAEEARAVFRDAVAAHQADRFAHHLRAPARVPQLGGGAKDVGQRVQKNETQKRIGFQLCALGVVGRQVAWQAEEICRPFRRFTLQFRARSGRR